MQDLWEHLWRCRSIAQDAGVAHQFIETAIFIATPI